MTTRGHVLVLRGCYVDDDGRLYSEGGGRRLSWPRSGHVEAPDGYPNQKCGNGLYGFLWGEGDETLWLGEVGAVIAIDPADIVYLDGRVKFRRGNVVYAGGRKEAAQYIKERKPDAAVMYCTSTAGDYGTARAEDYGVAVAGNQGIAVAGVDGIAVAGGDGNAAVGYGGTASAGVGGCICIRGRGGMRCAAVDGTRILPGVAYRLDANDQFVEVGR